MHVKSIFSFALNMTENNRQHYNWFADIDYFYNDLKKLTKERHPEMLFNTWLDNMCDVYDAEMMNS